MTCRLLLKGGLMNIFFENNCTYTYDYYLQLKRKTMDKGFMTTGYVFLCIVTAVGVFGFIKGWNVLGLTMTAAALFFLYRLFVTPMRLAAFASRQNRKLHGKDVETVNQFFDDHILAVNKLTGNKTNIKYTEIRKLLQTKNLFIIGMEQGLVLLIDKDGFTEGSCGDFVSFMKERCVNAEVQL